jgi:hypothetical protein
MDYKKSKHNSLTKRRFAMQRSNLTDKIADLFDETISTTNKELAIQQLKENADSADDLEFINLAATALTPSSEIKAGKTLKDNVMKQIHESSEVTNNKPGRIIPFLRPGWKKIASIAALLLVTLAIAPIFGPRLFNTNAKAMTLLNNSIEAILNIKTMFISFQVRSVPGENLDLIDTKGDFIDYKLWKQFTPTVKWRIEKPGMIVAMDGQKQFRFMEKTGIGIVGSTEAGFVDWMKILLDPEKILKAEKAFADKYKAKYDITYAGNETILTVKAKALGDFKNAYNLNTSIPESDNRRVYSFDKQSGRLKSLEVYVSENKSEVLVLKINKIVYDETITAETFSIDLPGNTIWVELKDIQPKAGNITSASTAEETAKMWWNALSESDWVMVYKLDPSFEHSSNLEAMKLEYGGLQIMSIGSSFKSGRYAGVYVPYEAKLKSGEVLKYNLALRKDNPQKAWIIDGGY